MEQSGLTRWGVDKLAVLYTLHAGVPGRYGVRCTTSWCDLNSCLCPYQCPTSCRAWQALSTGSLASLCVFCVRVLTCICMCLCACACPCVCVCACVCTSDCVRACACVTVCGVCARVCVVKSWRPGLRSMCVCVCGNVEPCRLESIPGRKRKRTPTRGYTRLSPPPPRATRG